MKFICKHIKYADPLFLFGLLIIFNLTRAAGQSYPQNYFRYPLDSLPNLVSPFGGLRDNHFHSGIDLRTNGREGYPVYAAADGYVSRIKVQRNGYGRAIYIDHPNGYTTVYGHLKFYNGPIAAWVHQFQYKNRSFEFDLVFDKPVLYVKKGDTIGFSGNSGGSTGPHLHYEIRDTRSEKIINPALFGLIPYDTFSPVIRNVMAYKFVKEGLILKQKVFFNRANLLQVDSGLICADTIHVDQDLYGFGIETYDYIHNANDEKGIYSYSFFRDGKELFSHKLTKFAFDESRFINVHIDYPYYKTERIRIQKCFIDDGNRFSTYTVSNGEGRTFFKTGESGYLKFAVTDASGNVTRLYVPYTSGRAVPDPEVLAYKKSLKGKKVLLPLSTSVVILPGFKAVFDPGCLYDTVYCKPEQQPRVKHGFSPVYKLHEPYIPLQKAVEISIRPTGFKSTLKNKLVMASVDKSGALRYAGGHYEGGWVKGRVSNFGRYCVTSDTLPPTIKMIPVKPEFDPSDTLMWNFDIRDNFSGISSWEVYLNDRWVLTDFDAKNNLLIYRFDEIYNEVYSELNNLIQQGITDPAFDIRIRVKDNAGNKADKTLSIPFRH